VSFASTSLPDGEYPLSVRAPGYHVSGTLPVIAVDSTPPRLLGCAPETSPPHEMSSAECVHLVFTEPVYGATSDARLVVAGTARATEVSFHGTALALRLCPSDTVDPAALPAAETVSLPPLTDGAGNTGAPGSCEPMTLRAWRAIHGAPLAGIEAAEVAFPDYFCELWADVVAISPQDVTGGGKVRAWRLAAAGGPPRFEVAETFEGAAGSVAAELSATTWIERVGGGAGLVRTCVPPREPALNADTGGDASAPAAWTRLGTTVAWSEADPAGGRRIRAVNAMWRSSPWESLGSSPALTPGAVASEPAVAQGMVAWLETPPGGVAQLRAAVPSATRAWTLLPVIANADPGTDAAEPALSSDEAPGRLFVAWREAALVRVQLIEDGVASGDPAVLNVDPARRARTPKFSRIWLDLGYFADHYVYWVEDSPRGDEIWARHWNGSEWELLPGPVNAGDPGTEVRSFDVHQRSVVWSDETGAVRLRVAGW
jgi:hypothetical protein